MTNDERHIAVLNRMLENMDVYDSIQPTTERKKAIKAAIKALEQQPITTTNNDEPITVIYPTTVCDDAISREMALDTISELNAISFYEAQEDSKECYYEIRQAVENMPPVTPQQKSRKWIEHPEIETSASEYLMFYECSECGNKPCFCKSDIHKKRFCSNCGAKMQERR